mmetsp:Transcript_117380/g.357132  ORF Transcript_117380/g.357132 Transcript_117380/m.357132 type:complete len:255 (-) Transcript_117380:263-1027(-)
MPLASNSPGLGLKTAGRLEAAADTPASSGHLRGPSVASPDASSGHGPQPPRGRALAPLLGTRALVPLGALAGRPLAPQALALRRGARARPGSPPLARHRGRCRRAAELLRRLGVAALAWLVVFQLRQFLLFLGRSAGGRMPRGALRGPTAEGLAKQLPLALAAPGLAPLLPRAVLGRVLVLLPSAAAGPVVALRRLQRHLLQLHDQHAVLHGPRGLVGPHRLPELVVEDRLSLERDFQVGPLDANARSLGLRRR